MSLHISKTRLAGDLCVEAPGMRLTQLGVPNPSAGALALEERVTDGPARGRGGGDHSWPGVLQGGGARGSGSGQEGGTRSRLPRPQGSGPHCPAVADFLGVRLLRWALHSQPTPVLPSTHAENQRTSAHWVHVSLAVRVLTAAASQG